MKILRSLDDLDFGALVRPGDRITFGQGCAEPTALTTRLVAQKDQIGQFHVFLGALFSDTFAPDKIDGIWATAYGVIGRSAALSRAGRLDVLPWHYSAIGDAFASGRLRADIVLLQLSPAIEGRYTLSVASDYAALAARHARVVVAEINARAPWVHGGELPADFLIHLAVETDRPLVELPPGRLGDTERRIAERVAALVPDGGTLQFGVGSIPDAILSSLAQHRDLGIHSGLIGDRVVDLIEGGAVTNSRKPFDAGVSVGGVLFGTTRLNELAHRNPAIAVRPPSHTHGHQVLRRLPDLIAINSAIEVDLHGAINAEWAEGVYLGAVGGQLDFVRGASAAERGRAVIALPATAKGGRISRIVPRVAAVTTPGSDVDVIVTEWGMAELRGCALGERARRVAAIAAPEFREDLERAAAGLARG